MTDISRGLELSNVGPNGLHLVEKKPGQLLHGGMTDELDDSPMVGNDLPSGLINHANTCFLASATQTLVTIPSIKHLVQVCFFKMVYNKAKKNIKI